MKTRLISFIILFISCGLLHAQQRIIGGSAIDITQRPYQAAIFVNGEFLGGGVILNDQWILTAAHVVDGYSASSITVSTGYTNLNNDSRRSSISQVTKHPDYGAFSGTNDIALIKLSSPLSFSSTRKPITVSNSTSYAYGTAATISGWGRRSVDGVPSLSQLYKANATIVACSSNDLTAGPSSNSPYKGDSGGPLTISSAAGDLLIGLARAVADLYNPTAYDTYYTNVGTHYNWIASYTSLYTISGDNLVCSTSTFTINPIPINHTLELSPNVTLVSQSGGSLTLRGGNKGRGYVNILVNNKIVGQKFFWVGAPIISGITYNAPYLKAETFGISASISNTQWTVGGNSFSSSSDYLSSPYSSGTHTVSVRATNACGTGDTYTTEVSFSYGRAYSIILNAGSRSVTVIPVPDDSGNTNSSVPKATSPSTLNYTLVGLNTGNIATSGMLPMAGGTLDFMSVTSGLYLLKLYAENGIEETFKIVLN